MKKKSSLIFSIALLGLYGFGCADSNEDNNPNGCDVASYVSRCDGSNYQTICINGMEGRVQCSNACDQATGKCTSGNTTLTCIQTGCQGNQVCNQQTGLCENNSQTSCVQTGCPTNQTCNQQTGLCENNSQTSCVQTGCPTNQTCNQQTGLCENNSQTSCVQTGCNPTTEWCNASTGLCQIKNCQEGAKECRGDSTKAVCNTENYDWNVTNCNANEKCVGGDCVSKTCADLNCNPDTQWCDSTAAVPTCKTKECNAGDKRCDNISTKAVCNTATYTYDVTTCQANEKCDAGNCVPKTCDDLGCNTSQWCDPTAATPSCHNKQCDSGQKECQAGQKAVCNAATYSWDLTNCNTNEKCLAGDCIPKDCVDLGCESTPATPVCDTLTGQCIAAPEQSCATTGCEANEWCNTSTGHCVTKQCNAGDKKCDSTSAKSVCNTATYTYDVINCNVGEKCVEGDCVAKTCEDITCQSNQWCNPSTVSCANKECDPIGSKECRSSNTQAAVCVDNYTWNITSCGSNKICRGGVCELKECTTIGDKECRNNNTQAAVCTDIYTWNVTTCNSDETCQSGACVPKVAYDTSIIEANQGIRTLCPDKAVNCSKDTEYTVNGRVTAIGKAGFFIQTPDCTDPYAGLYIYTNKDTITANLHDDVTVKGKVASHYGIYQLTDPTVTIKSSGNTPITPVTISGTDLDSYQSMLVGYKNITILEKAYGQYTTTNTDNTKDPIYKFTKVGDNDLHLGGYSSYTYKMEEPVVGTTYSKADGIMMFEYNRYRIFPRNAADLVVSGVPVVLASVAANTTSAVKGETITITVSMSTKVTEATTIQIACTGSANCPKSTSIAAGSKEATFSFTMPAADVKVTATLGEVSKEVTIAYDDTTGTTVTETFNGTFKNNKSGNKTCATTSYCSGTFNGSDTKLTWTYNSLRSNLTNSGITYDIEGAGIILYRSNGADSNITTTIATGMKSVSLQAKQAFSGGTAADRKVKISVNGTACIEQSLQSSDKVETIKCTGLTPTANSVLLIESTGSKQVTIDNISWTY